MIGTIIMYVFIDFLLIFGWNERLGACILGVLSLSRSLSFTECNRGYNFTATNMRTVVQIRSSEGGRRKLVVTMPS
jgi:hypothetical protein